MLEQKVRLHMSISNEPVAAGQRGRRRISTESEIETAALAAFELNGFDDLTMDEIALAAGVSVRTAFRYFPSKVDTVLYTARQISSLLSKAIPASTDAPPTLHAVEDAITLALGNLIDHQPDAIVRLRRVRTLMITDARLRAEVAKAEGHLAGLDASTPDEISLAQRMFQEIVAATLRAAFDSWASEKRNTDADDAAEGGARLLEDYARARAIRSQLIN
jgi:AcrR family transcriptional regulator